MVQVQKDSAGNWQRVKDTYTGLEANFLVLINYDDWLNKQNIQPIGYLTEQVTEENKPDETETIEWGLPVYDFSADQSFELSGKNEYIVTPAGLYIVEDVTRFSGETVTQMVQVQKDSAGNWQRVKDTYTGLEATFLVLINYGDWLDKQNIQPIGYLTEQVTEETKTEETETIERGLPVYYFSADQSFELSGKNEYIVTPAGSYIVENVTRFSGESVTQMVQVQKDSAGNWQRVKDTYTGLETNFLVLINYDDWLDTQNIHPIGYLFETVESLVQKTKGSKIQLLGKTLANGGSEIASRGFIWSDNPTFKNSHAVRGTLLLDYQQEMIFEANVSGVLSDTLYYKAFVENEEGLNFGAPKLIELEGIESPWWKEFPVLSGDWRSSWMGDFHPYDNGWIYHLHLGWTYVVNDSQDELWLWLRNYGWLWTKEGVYPYLWQHNKSEWFYLISGKGSSPILYQHSTKTWEKLK
jgi:hypothetical protein